MRKAALLIVAIILIAVVALSLFRQNAREATVGERMIAALARDGYGPRLHAAPAAADYITGDRTGFFELVVGDDRFWIDRAASQVEIGGNTTGTLSVRDPAPPHETDRAITLRLPGDTRRVSPDVEYVSIEGVAESVTYETDHYRLSCARGGGAIRAALAPHPATDGAVARAVAPFLLNPADATALVAEQRAALVRLDERSLLDALLSADAAILERESNPAGAVRRVLLLLAIDPPNLVATSEDGEVYALTDPIPLRTGENVVHVYTFNAKGALIFRGRLFVKPSADPEKVRDAIYGVFRR